MANTKKMTVRVLVVGFALAAFAGCGWAQQEQGGPGGGGRRGPPPEALDACSGANDGDQCGFTARDGRNIQGTCFAPRQDLPLACKPEGMGGPDGGQRGQQGGPGGGRRGWPSGQ